jgi:hypothetical protein
MNRNLVVNGDISLRESGNLNIDGGDIHLNGSFTINNGIVNCNNTELDKSFKILILKAIGEALNTPEPELAVMLTSVHAIERDYAKMIFDMKAILKDTQ